MAINFPDSPTNGQVATIGGKNYTYNSTKNTWTPTQVTEADLSSVGSTTVVATHDLLPSSPSAGDMALVSSVNKMYVYFLSGWWLMSSLQNASPSGITGNAAIYDLASDGTPTTVTLSSSDPEGFPISWSHSVISGSLGGTTVTNVDNVFTITPSTDAADAGTFTLRFAAADGQGGESGSQSNFTLDFVFTVTDSKYTTLLATAVDTSDNNNITDASTNNHTITVNGDAHAGTFSPYRSGGYSTYFDGTGDYLLTPTSSDFTYGTNDFTIECWVYIPSHPSNYSYLFAQGNSTSNTNSFGVYIQSGVFKIWNGARILTGTTSYSLNTWTHIALNRSGNSLKLYIDGAQEGSTITNTSNISTGSSAGIEIARWVGVGDSAHFNGYISDLRIVKGTAITPPSGGPTERLEAVVNTSLLTCHLPYISDGSTNDHSITINGDPETKPFSPYDYEEYSATDHGGSVYFDGAGDYLLFNSPPTLGANDWTFETWYYASNSFGNNNILLSQGPGNNTLVSNFSISTTGELWIQTYTTSNVVLYNTAAGIIKEYTWNHIVLTHDYDGSNGGTYKIYANGNQVGNVSYTSGYYWNSGGISGTPLAMAQYRYNTQANGACYFSDWKISNSVTYSSNFTPPTAPLSSTGAELHIKGTDASIIDKSQSANLKLVGSVDNGWGLDKFITSQQAVEFNGSTQYLTVAGSSDFDFGSNDFTIEAWVYTDSSDDCVITSGRPNGSSWIFLDKTSSNTIRILISTDGSSWAVNSTSTETMTLGRWNHISVSRDGSTINMYLNGRLIVSTSISGSIHYNTSEKIAIGSGENDRTDRGWNGYISDFRIINGTAVVPPVNGPNEALTEVTNTKLLTCRPSGASITDLSTTGTTHTITSISSTAAAYASPFGKAMYFDGSDDHIEGPTVSDLNIGTGDFTIECWIYETTTNTNKGIWDGRLDGTSTDGFTFTRIGVDTFRVWSGGALITTGSFTIQNTWNHCALVRNSGTLTIYINGTSSGTPVSNSTNFSNSGTFIIGAGRHSTGSNPTAFITGYIQDLRVNNYARYTTNFTPPTAPLEG